MDQAAIQQLLQNIKKYADLAYQFGATYVPPQALIPLVIGKAVIDLAPTIEQDIANMISGSPPTPEQEAAAIDKLRVLSDPNTP